jgi:hypothetical protein
MKILRTDGGGESHTNERLRTLRKMLLNFEIKNIYLLHDHKGLLTVIWENKPDEKTKQKVADAWEYFHEYEIEHKLLTFIDL